MLQILPYLSVFVIPALLVLSATLGGGWVLLLPVVVYGLLPVLDLATGPNRDNSAPTAPTWAYRMLPRVFVPVHLAALSYALVVASHSSLAVGVGLATAAGMATVLAINIAHELMHRAGRLDQRLSVVLMASAAYPHFVVEHVQGHHKNVATPFDSASSRLGENVWAFLPRTLVGGLRSAWHIEAARSDSRWGPSNRVVRWWALLLVGIAVLTAWSPLIAAAFVFQAGVAVTLLEIINYVEHYGLSRAPTAAGRYERTLPRHSWNSPERVTNWFLLNLQRHSDHHAFAGRPYEQLRHYEDVPQLPAGYPWMVLLATVPPLWFRVMDRRVSAWQQGPAA